MHIIPHDELPRRRPVWEALSDLFLDNELSDARLREIAGVLRASGYSPAELDDILATEIAPLLYRNLYSMTGVWDGFDVDWIERELLAGRHRDIRKWFRVIDRWMCGRALRSVREEYWNGLMSRMAG